MIKGKVMNGRVDGGLALSRAFGDFEYKMRSDLPPMCQKVIPIPDVTVLRRCHGPDEYVLLACDGLWDVMKTSEGVAAASRGLGFPNFPPAAAAAAPPNTRPRSTSPPSAAAGAKLIAAASTSAPAAHAAKGGKGAAMHASGAGARACAGAGAGAALSNPGPPPDGATIRSACDALVQLALQKETRDNVSVLLVLPSRHPRRMSTHASNGIMMDNIATSVARHAVEAGKQVLLARRTTSRYQHMGAMGRVAPASEAPFAKFKAAAAARGLSVDISKQRQQVFLHQQQHGGPGALLQPQGGGGGGGGENGTASGGAISFPRSDLAVPFPT